MSSAVQLEGIITDRQVVVHPLVLLSAVDHYNRIAQGTNKRVVGALLGEYIGSNIDVTNAYAVPFEEDPRDSNIWFLDHNFHESMYLMFRKVNAKESIVGWYSTGPKIKPADLKIHEVFRRYCAQPVYVIIDVKPKAETLPTDAYFSLEEPTSNKMFRRTFVHIPSTIGATEPEEVGVEHLLRDIKNANTSTLSTQVMDKLSSLKQLIAKLKELQEYLKDVIGGKLPPNPKILYNLQDIFNSLPDLDNNELVKSLSLESNDIMLSIYIGSVVRATIGLHNLILNKLASKARLQEDADKARQVKAKEDDQKKQEEKNMPKDIEEQAQ
eukprot:GHVR01078399.1.p2 GENE.GHVR01078399.1~~GHVR01078399.1.p2  ORF type:complete len:326 (-),score=58.90 GHVR01078399.1:1315-2292(-)